MIRIDVSFTIFITLFLLMFGCKKETPTNNEACSPTWSSISDSGCLETKEHTQIATYINGVLDSKSIFTFTNSFQYEGRKLVAYHPQNGPKDIPVTYYEYNECNQIIATKSTNLRSGIYYDITKYTYYDANKINKITYSQYLEQDKQTIPKGYTQYFYQSNSVVAHTFDGNNIKTKSETTLYNNTGQVKEVWYATYSNTDIKVVKNIYNVAKFGVYSAGDIITTTYSDNNRVDILKTDSVFYNEFGNDTICYNSYYQNNIIVQRQTIKRKYINCN